MIIIMINVIVMITINVITVINGIMVIIIMINVIIVIGGVIVIIIMIIIMIISLQSSTSITPSQPTPKEKVQHWIQARGKLTTQYKYPQFIICAPNYVSNQLGACLSLLYN